MMSREKEGASPESHTRSLETRRMGSATDGGVCVAVEMKRTMRVGRLALGEE